MIASAPDKACCLRGAHKKMLCSGSCCVALVAFCSVYVCSPEESRTPSHSIRPSHGFAGSSLDRHHDDHHRGIMLIIDRWKAYPRDALLTRLCSCQAALP